MRVAFCALLICGLTGGHAAAQQTRNADCNLEDAGTGTVRAVLDGRTFVLTDGREVRLAAIELPSANHGAQASKAALEAMLGGRTVVLKRLGADTDRYGRLAAHAFTAQKREQANDQEPGWAQQALLAAGHARVATSVGDAACATRLLHAERAARSAGLGLWSEPGNAPRSADDPPALLAERGRFTLVEGRVVSVRESGGTIYVNFGRRWSEDFTVTVLRRNEKAFIAAGLVLKQLAGRNVRVRGFIEERGGPWIEVSRPEQIELVRD